MEEETSRMNRRIKTTGFWLWVLAVVITLFSAYFQRTTGPTYPIKGTVSVGDQKIHYKLLRSSEATKDARIAFKAPEGFAGVAFFKRYKSSDPLKAMILAREGDELVAYLPSLPPAGKMEYYIVVRHGSSEARFPMRPAILRFKGYVPAFIMILHILFMFAAMLIAARAGLEAITRGRNLNKLAWWTFTTLLIGGFIFGPIMQHYAFGDWWTGVPLGWDLTDNKTLIALIAWIVALVVITRSGGMQAPKAAIRVRWAAFIAAFIMLAVFMIPHSIFGTELDYSKPANDAPPVVINIK
jgi:hypothetical protein